MNGRKPPDILIAVGTEETRVVVAVDGEPIEARVERQGNPSEIGNVYLGRVTKVVPALE